MKSERSANKKYTVTRCAVNPMRALYHNYADDFVTYESICCAMCDSRVQPKYWWNVLNSLLGTKMLVKRSFFLRKQRYNTVRNGSRARIIYTSGSVELSVSNPLIAWTAEQVFLMFRIWNIKSYLALVPSPSQQIRPESEWPCLVCNFLSSSCSRQWVPITEYVLVLKHFPNI